VAGKTGGPAVYGWTALTRKKTGARGPAAEQARSVCRM